MSAHTPGPWTVLGARKLLHIETRDSPVGDGFHICSVPLSREGDAHLIAAAPKMLAALKAVEDAQPGAYQCVRDAIEEATPCHRGSGGQ